MSADPYAGYVGHPVDTVKKAMAAIFPTANVELIKEGTNPAPGLKPNRMRVFYNDSTRLVTKVLAG